MSTTQTLTVNTPEAAQTLRAWLGFSQTQYSVRCAEHSGIDLNKNEIRLANPDGFGSLTTHGVSLRASLRALKLSPDTLGGYFGESFDVISQVAAAQGDPLLPYVNVITDTAQTNLRVALASDTVTGGCLIVGDLPITSDGRIPVSRTPSTSATWLRADREYSSGLIKVSNTLRNSALLEPLVTTLLFRAVNQARGANHISGTGVGGQPIGLNTAAGISVTAGNGTAVTGDDIPNLINAANTAYRPGSVFVMHSTTFANLTKLKDGNGQRLLLPITRGPQPTLWNYPVIEHDSMSTPASGNKSIFFLNPTMFVVRQLGAVTVLRYAETFGTESLALQNVYGYEARVPSDSALIDANACVALVH